MPEPLRRARGVMLHGRASAGRCSRKLPSRLCRYGPLPRTNAPLGIRPKHLLASIDLKSNSDAMHAAAIVHGRMVGATEHEISAAIPTIRRVLQQPVLRRAAANSGKGVLR